MFAFFGIKKRTVDLRGDKNKNRVKTKVSPRDVESLKETVELLNGKFLDIFRREPYINMSGEWVKILARN